MVKEGTEERTPDGGAPLPPADGNTQETEGAQADGRSGGAHTEEELKDTLERVAFFTSAHDDRQLGRDPFQTDQQRHRDERISDLLDEYTESYKDKRRFREQARSDLFLLCTAIIVGASVLFGLLVCKVLISPQTMEIAELGTFITACVGFLVLVIKLLEIITRYCFPENDEEYITRIVQSIQENDLQNKLANIGYKQKNDSKPPSKK